MKIGEVKIGETYYVRDSYLGGNPLKGPFRFTATEIAQVEKKDSWSDNPAKMVRVVRGVLVGEAKRNWTYSKGPEDRIVPAGGEVSIAARYIFCPAAEQDAREAEMAGREAPARAVMAKLHDEYDVPDIALSLQRGGEAVCVAMTVDEWNDWFAGGAA